MSTIRTGLEDLLGKTVGIWLHGGNYDRSPDYVGEVISLIDHPSITIRHADGSHSTHSSLLRRTVMTEAAKTAFGDVVLRRQMPVVVEAPDRALLSIAALQKMSHTHVLGPDRLFVGELEDYSPVYYRVTGWNAQERALIIERVEPAMMPTAAPDGDA